MPARKLQPDEQHLLALVPPEAKLGPAMLALSDRHRVFVCARVGGKTQVEAARIAGYVAQPKSLEVIACRIDHDERVQAAYNEELRRGLQTSAALMTLPVLKEIIADPKQAARDRIAAIKLLLERTVPVQTEHAVHVTHHMSREQAMAEIVAHMRLKGEDPRQVLGWLHDTTPEDARIVEAAAVEQEAA